MLKIVHVEVNINAWSHLVTFHILYYYLTACITQRMGPNKTNSLEPCTQGEELCHYHGYIKNKNRSSAAISTCGGLVSYLLKLLCVNKLSYEN